MRHVSLTHSQLQTFSCAEKFCQKSFSLLNTFLRHRRANHELGKEVLAPSIKKISPSILISGETCAGETIDEKSKLDFAESFYDDSQFYVDFSDSEDNSTSDDDLLFASRCQESASNLIDERTQMVKNVFEQELQFVSKYYRCPDISRKKVNSIISDTSKLLHTTVNKIKNEVYSRLKNVGANGNYIQEIKDLFIQFSKPLENMKTEKQCFSKFKNFDIFIVPQSYKIGERK